MTYSINLKCILMGSSNRKGPEEHLEFVKVTPSRLVRFHSGSYRLFEELSRHVSKGWLQECPNCGACKVLVEHVLFDCS